MDFRGIALALIIISGAVTMTIGRSQATDRTLYKDHSRKFHMVNLSGGNEGMNVTSTGGGGTTEVGISVPPSAAVVNRAALNGNPNSAKFEVKGSGSSFAAISQETKLDHDNLVIALKVDINGKQVDKVHAIPMPTRNEPQLILAVDGAIDGASSFDVYITAPGADLATATADAKYSTIGDALQISLEKVLVHHEYQLRLCKPGTKEVIADSGVVSGLDSGNYRVHGFVHENGKPSHRIFTQDAYQS